MATAQIAKGITVTFANYVGDLMDVEGENFERPMVDVTHQGSGEAREKIVGAFFENMPVTLTVNDNPTFNPRTLITAAASTLTIAFPVPSGYTNGATFVCTAACTKVGKSSKLGEKITRTIELTPTGDGTYTPAS